MSTARSIGTIGFYNLIGSVVAVANTMVTAYYFGTTRLIEVYFAALQMEHLVLKLAQSGALAQVFLPIYTKGKEQVSAEHAHRSASVILNWILVAFGLLSLLSWFGALYVIKLLVPGFSHEDHVLGMWMFRALIPLMVLEIVASLLHTLANAEAQYGKPEFYAIVARVLGLVAILALVAPFGVWALIGALWVATLVKMLGLAAVLRGTGFRYHLVLREPGFSIREMVRIQASIYSYVVTTQFYTFVMNAMISLLPQGLYAIFNYVSTLAAKVEPMTNRPVSIVFFTQFSRAFARGAQSLRDLSRVALGRVFGITVLTNVLVIVGGSYMLDFIWGGDKFTPSEIALATDLLLVFFLLKFATGYNMIAQKIVMAVGHPQLFYHLLSVVQVMSALVAWLLIRRFGFGGLIGLLIFNRIGFVVVPVLILSWRARRWLPTYPLALGGKWALAGSAGLGIGFWVRAHLPAMAQLDGRLFSLAVLCILSAAALAASLAVAWLLNVRDVRALFSRRILFPSKG